MGMVLSLVVCAQSAALGQESWSWWCQPPTSVCPPQGASQRVQWSTGNVGRGLSQAVLRKKLHDARKMHSVLSRVGVYITTDCLNYNEICENSAPGFLLDYHFCLVSNRKVFCFLFHIFPKSEIFSVINLEAVAIRLNCRSRQKHCTNTLH